MSISVVINYEGKHYLKSLKLTRLKKLCNIKYASFR